MGNRRQKRQGFLTGLFFVLTGATAGLADTCRPEIVELRGDWGTAQFSIELADDATERAQGLMHRDSMAMSSGMLFVYDTPDVVSFWMRNTLIPLDMIFADEKGIVRHVHHNAVPLSEDAILGGTGIQYVLEINGGLAGALGIAKGSTLRHPAIDDTLAAWSCDQ